MPWRVPPKWDATCLVHLKGVSNAHAQQTDMWGLVPGSPQSFLVCKNFLAHGVPAFVEFAPELLDPLFGRVVRRMGAAGSVVQEERLLGRCCVQLAHVADGVVSHGGCEIPSRLVDPRENLRVVLEQKGSPLTGFTADESVKIVEPHPRGPLIKRTGGADLKRWGIVVFTEPGRGVAVLFENRADRSLLKKISTCQRQRCRSAMVFAGRVTWSAINVRRLSR